MKICPNYSTLFTLSLSLASLAGAAENDWKLLSATYSTTSSQYVTKDKGSLTVTIATGCASTYADAESELAEATAEITRALEKYDTVKIANPKPDLNISTIGRYRIQGGDEPRVIDTCNNEQAVTQPLGEIDLTATTFTGSAEILIETTQKIGTLTEIRQKLNLFAADLNKADNKTKITVPQEIFGISAERRSEAQATLDSETQLIGGNQNRLNVDRQISGGFSEAYVIDVRPQNEGFSGFGRQQGLTYRTIRPKVDANGKSVLTAYYTFDVRYLPKNFATSVEPSEDLIGNRQFTGKGTVITDTDYYVGQITLSSACHPSEKAATDAILAAAQGFRDEAHTVADTSKISISEQVRTETADPYAQDTWTRWQLAKTEPQPPELSAKQDQGDAENKKWLFLNLCDGKTQVATDSNSLPKSFQVSYKITVFTKNFEGLKKFSALAAKFNEGKTGSTRVQATATKIDPRLDPRKHFEAVEVIAYKNALENLLDPSSDLAKFVTGEAGASEAYYTFSYYGSQPPRDSGGNQKAAFGAAPGRSRSALESSADEASPLDAYSAIDTKDGDIPQGELQQDLLYSLRYRPRKDLVTLIRERREATPKPEGGVELR
ncbi:MAG TPA: hypothetical protein VM901_04010 [Bdellovibrionota bacterium]|jgi:hypothetical protein|nr:hypothetical protein [Bdellovibrionota bacterium]